MSRRDPWPRFSSIERIGRASQHGFEVHFFAGLVDAAIGEDGSAQQRMLLGEIEVRVEFVRADAFGPVARDVRRICPTAWTGRVDLPAARRLPQ